MVSVLKNNSPTYSLCSKKAKQPSLRISAANSGKLLTIATLIIFAACSFAFAQDRKPMTIDQIGELLKDGVRPGRIAQLVEQHGIDFEANESVIRRLRNQGADDVLLSSVKKMAARYTEDQQRRKRIEAEDEKRQRVDAERKRQEELAKQMEEIRRRLKLETKKEEVAKKAEAEQKRQSAEAVKPSRETPTQLEERKREAQDTTKQRAQESGRATLIAQEDVGRTATLQNIVSTQEGTVSGEIVNQSKYTLRDIQLQILYSWRWKNEYHPGKDDPGTAKYYSLEGDVAPGRTGRFEYKPSPPFPPRTDGHYDITIKIVGFAQVIPGVVTK
jgi:hypothetical protein